MAVSISCPGTNGSPDAQQPGGPDLSKPSQQGSHQLLQVPRELSGCWKPATLPVVSTWQLGHTPRPVVIPARTQACLCTGSWGAGSSPEPELGTQRGRTHSLGISLPAWTGPRAAGQQQAPRRSLGGGGHPSAYLEFYI